MEFFVEVANLEDVQPFKDTMKVADIRFSELGSHNDWLRAVMPTGNGPLDATYFRVTTPAHEGIRTAIDRWATGRRMDRLEALVKAKREDKSYPAQHI